MRRRDRIEKKRKRRDGRRLRMQAVRYLGSHDRWMNRGRWLEREARRYDGLARAKEMARTGSILAGLKLIGRSFRDRDVIRWVQAQLGVTVDGIWGPASQHALDKAGFEYDELAPAKCFGPVPTWPVITSPGGRA